MDRELIWKTINIAFLLSTAIGLVYPAFVDNKTFTQIFVSLWEPELSIGWISRWIVLLAFMASLYAIVVGMIYRKIPITTLSSKIQLTYLDKDGKKVEIRRDQILRANQRHVTAFFTTHSATAPTGKLSRADISMSTYWVGGNLNDRFEMSGTDKRIEVIHIFGRPLPYAWFMPLVPLWFLRGEYHSIPYIFRRFTISRRSRVVYEDEFTADRTMEFQADAYPVNNFLVCLDFSKTELPSKDKIIGRRIKNHGVIHIDPEYIPSDKKVIFRVDNLQNERLKVSWEF
jgi:hypothetical protein